MFSWLLNNSRYICVTLRGRIKEAARTLRPPCHENRALTRCEGALTRCEGALTRCERALTGCEKYN